MTRRTSIGGVLDLAALELLAGPDPCMRHFQSLDRDAQAAAVRRLALVGRSDHGIARATGLAVEQVRQILSEHPK